MIANHEGALFGRDGNALKYRIHPRYDNDERRGDQFDDVQLPIGPKSHTSVNVDQILCDTFLDGIQHQDWFSVRSNEVGHSLRDLALVSPIKMAEFVGNILSTYNEIFKSFDVLEIDNKNVSFGHMYLVSTHARVFSLKSWEYLKPKPNPAGYYIVTLFLDHSLQKMLMNRLVATVHISASPGLDFQVHHIDENPKNNNVTNLQWLSRADHIKETGPFRKTRQGRLLNRSQNKLIKAKAKPHPLDELGWIDMGTFKEKLDAIEISRSSNCRFKKSGKLCQTRLLSHGYVRIYLRKSSYLLHRLVAAAFVEGRTDERKVVDHKNRDRQDNKFSNLRWVTTTENNILANGKRVEITIEKDGKVEKKEFGTLTFARKELGVHFSLGDEREKTVNVSTGLNRGTYHVRQLPNDEKWQDGILNLNQSTALLHVEEGIDDEPLNTEDELDSDFVDFEDEEEEEEEEGEQDMPVNNTEMDEDSMPINVGHRRCAVTIVADDEEEAEEGEQDVDNSSLIGLVYSDSDNDQDEDSGVNSNPLVRESIRVLSDITNNYASISDRGRSYAKQMDSVKQVQSKRPCTPNDSPSRKKSKSNKSTSSASIRVIVTGEKNFKKDAVAGLEGLGISIVDHPKDANYVASSRVKRTPKFLSCLANVEGQSTSNTLKIL